MLLKLLHKLKFKKQLRKKFSDQLSIQSSSVLLEGSNIDFRVGKQKRHYITIGEKCLINACFVFETQTGDVKIGNNVHLGGVNIICRSKIVIENDVTMAWGITLYDHNSHSIYWSKRQNDNVQCYSDYFEHNGNNVVNKDWSSVVEKPITIKSKAWIGFNVIILKGVTIGEGAVIGAGSIVTQDVPDWSVAAGNPARVVKSVKE